jgi:hypothetical protein
MRRRRAEAGLAGKSMETGGRTVRKRSRGRSAPAAAKQQRRRRAGGSVSFPTLKAQELSVRAEEASEQRRATSGVLGRFRRLIQRVIGAEERTQLEAQRRAILQDIRALKVPTPRLSVRSTPQRVQAVEAQLQDAEQRAQALADRTDQLGDAIGSAGAALTPEELSRRLPKARPVRKSRPPPSGTPKPRTKKRCPAGLRRGPGNRCYNRGDVREIKALQRHLRACGQAVPIAEKLNERFHARVPLTVLRSVAPRGVSLLPKMVRAPRSSSSLPKTGGARRKAVGAGKRKVRRQLFPATRRKKKATAAAAATSAAKPKKKKATKAAPKRKAVASAAKPKRKVAAKPKKATGRRS